MAQSFVDEVWRGAAIAWDVAAVLCVGSDGVLARQRRRLGALLEAAAAGSPIYRERLDRRNPAATPLGEIAPVTKPELMRRFGEWVCEPGLELDDLWRFAADPARIGQTCAGGHTLWTSSGNHGEPGLFIQDAQAMAVYDALETLRRPGPHPLAHWLGAGWAGGRLAFVGATTGHFASTVSIERLRRRFPLLAGSVRGFSFLLPTTELVAQLDAFAPTVIATYPTMAMLLARQVDAGCLRLALQEIWTGGETLTAAMREAIERSFACRVANSYGASEFLALAAQCRCGGLHLNADWAILESVDEHHRPVPDGQAGSTVLLTNLANHLQPLIRYDLGDRITIQPGPCACGSPLPRLDVQGRSGDLLTLRDAQRRTVHLAPLALATVIEDAAAVFDFQLEQTGDAALELRIAEPGESGRRALERALAALGHYLARQGLDQVGLQGRCGVAGPRGASGKLCRVIGPAPPQRCST